MLVFVRYPIFIPLAIAAENSKLKYIKAFFIDCILGMLKAVNIISDDA